VLRDAVGMSAHGDIGRNTRRKETSALVPRSPDTRETYERCKDRWRAKSMVGLSIWTVGSVFVDSDSCPMPGWFEGMEPEHDGPKKPALDALQGGQLGMGSIWGRGRRTVRREHNVKPVRCH